MENSLRVCNAKREREKKENAEKRNASFFCPLPRRAFCAFDAWNDERK